MPKKLKQQSLKGVERSINTKAKTISSGETIKSNQKKLNNKTVRYRGKIKLSTEIIELQLQTRLLNATDNVKVVATVEPTTEYIVGLLSTNVSCSQNGK